MTSERHCVVWYTVGMRTGELTKNVLIVLAAVVWACICTGVLLAAAGSVR